MTEVGDHLSWSQRKALLKLKVMVRKGMEKHEFTTPQFPPPPTPEEIEIWGVKLFQDDRTDVILLKFLRDRNFDHKKAFTMLKNTVLWRKRFGIEALVREDLGNHLDRALFMDGFGREGHPVCYSSCHMYEKFQDKEEEELYQNEQNFVRWKIQFMEKSVRKLDFSPGGINTIIYVHDCNNFPLPFLLSLDRANGPLLCLIRNHYPGFSAKQVYINSPHSYLVLYKVISPWLMIQRVKKDIVVAEPSKSLETLFKYIAPGQVPVQYGGMKKDGEVEFSDSDHPVTLVVIKPGIYWYYRYIEYEYKALRPSRLTLQLRFINGSGLSYDVLVVGEESDRGPCLARGRKVLPSDEPVTSMSYDLLSSGAGKVVIDVSNRTSEKKLLLCRFKTQPLDMESSSSSSSRDLWGNNIERSWQPSSGSGEGKREIFSGKAPEEEVGLTHTRTQNSGGRLAIPSIENQQSTIHPLPATTQCPITGAPSPPTPSREREQVVSPPPPTITTVTTTTTTTTSTTVTTTDTTPTTITTVGIGSRIKQLFQLILFLFILFVTCSIIYVVCV